LEEASNKQKDQEKQLDGVMEALNTANQSLQEAHGTISTLKLDLENAGTWLYPENLHQVVEAAKKYYSSKLIFHERVTLSINNFTQAETEKKYRIIPEAIKMIKALAETLYPMKFVTGNVSHDEFLNITGIPFSMTERRATKREKDLEIARTLRYNGQKITFFPHLKSSIQGLQFRIHFQFLDDEKKILVCHIGDHLPTAFTRKKK
jgi:hypothetical protein